MVDSRDHKTVPKYPFRRNWSICCTTYSLGVSYVEGEMTSWGMAKYIQTCEDPDEGGFYPTDEDGFELEDTEEDCEELDADDWDEIEGDE